MESNRILLSAAHVHTLTLSEQEIGVIIHALRVLEAAFDEEVKYRRLAAIARAVLAQELENPTTKIPLSPPR